MKLSEKIYYYRKKAGLSQDALAEAVGVSRQAVSKWETGDAVPETGKLLALASALGDHGRRAAQRGRAGAGAGSGPRQADGGCFTWDGGTAGGSGPGGCRVPDWVDQLPQHIRSASPAAGAGSSGVYVALGGLPIVIIGALARGVSNRMFGSFNDLWGGGFGSSVIIDGVEIPIKRRLANVQPRRRHRHGDHAHGRRAVTVAGIALARILKSKSK